MAKIKIDNALYEKVKTAAEVIGCASVDEFVVRVLESETDRVLQNEADRVKQSGSDNLSDSEVEDIASKLKGLGYLE